MGLNRRAKQRGAALIIVLLVMALVSIIAVEMGVRLQFQVKRATNIKDNNQAYWYAMGAEQFATKSIKQLLDADKDVVSLERAWNEEFVYPLEGGGIQAQLTDLQSCFNLNSLRESQSNSGEQDSGRAEELDAFQRLMTVSDLDIPQFNAETLRDSLADWLDSDGNLRNYGAEDSDYESLQHPYIAANNLMMSKSELRLVNGVELEWLPDLMKLVCVLPWQDELKVNINTMLDDQAPVLAALTGLSLGDAQGLISSRPQEGYEKVEDFLQQPEIVALELNDKQKGWFDVKTQHFLLTTKTKYNNATFSMSSLLKVDDNNQVSVIRREFGGVI